MAIDRSEFMITRSLIAFEDFLGSLIAPQVMPPWLGIKVNFGEKNIVKGTSVVQLLLFSFLAGRMSETYMLHLESL